MSVDPTEFVRKRRDRVLATILSYKEENIDQYLPPELRQQLRRVIMSNINDFNDLVLDMLKATEAEPVTEWNTLYFAQLSRIENGIKELLDD